MQLVDDSDALERIHVAIEAYRLQSNHLRNLTPGEFESVDAHLKRHLSVADWVLKCSLEAKVTLLDNAKASNALKMLLRQYKRAGYEYLQFCDQANQP